MINSKEILFIHGLHENAHVWIEWKLFFENLGYKCHTPSYPYHEGIPSELRQNPNRLLRKVGLNEVIDYYKNYIKGLSDKTPILVGHSMGGLIVQKLMQFDMGALGVCITSASPKGVMSFKWSFIKSNIGVINPFKFNSLYCGTKDWFHYAICNTMTRRQSDEIYDLAVVPESRNIPRSSRFNDGKIDFKKPHKPLLFIGAEKDHIIPISLVKKNVKAYKHTDSITEFKEFRGKAHSLCFQSGWQEVADYIHQWILKNGGFYK